MQRQLRSAAYAGLGDQLVDLAADRLNVGRVLAGILGVDSGSLEVRPGRREGPLLDRRRLRLQDRLGLKVPALPALRDPQPARSSRARRALARQRRPARQINQLGLAGDTVDLADRYRPDAHAALDRGCAYDLPSEWHPGPLGASLVAAHR